MPQGEESQTRIPSDPIGYPKQSGNFRKKSDNFRHDSVENCSFPQHRIPTGCWIRQSENFGNHGTRQDPIEFVQPGRISFAAKMCQSSAFCAMSFKRVESQRLAAANHRLIQVNRRLTMINRRFFVSTTYPRQHDRSNLFYKLMRNLIF